MFYSPLAVYFLFYSMANFVFLSTILAKKFPGQEIIRKDEAAIFSIPLDNSLRYSYNTGVDRKIK